MNLTKLVMKRPVAVIICIMALLIFGLSSVFTMPMELTPAMEMPVSLIMTTYPGAGPEEVDEQVTQEMCIRDRASTAPETMADTTLLMALMISSPLW